MTNEVRLWRFPYQIRIKCYDHWHFKIEKWLLGLKMVAWNIHTFIYDMERDAFAKKVGIK